MRDDQEPLDHETGAYLAVVAVAMCFDDLSSW
jgi:hypothetical protein